MFPEFLREWLSRDSNPESTLPASAAHPLPLEETTKPKKKDKETNHGAPYCGLENSVTVLSYHNNVKNGYYFLLFVRLIRKLCSESQR